MVSNKTEQIRDMTVGTRDPGLCNFEAEWIWLFGDFSRTQTVAVISIENMTVQKSTVGSRNM